MQFNLDQSIYYYGSLSIVTSACLYFCVELKRLKRKIKIRHLELDRDADVMSEQFSNLESWIDAGSARIQDLEDTVSGLSVTRRSQVLSHGIDATQRTQVIRMARRGDRPEQIAAELRVPRNEVDLLLKVQRATIARAS